MKSEQATIPSFGEAINALQIHAKSDSLWRVRAITLLQMVGQPDIDQVKLGAMCREHAERGSAI